MLTLILKRFRESDQTQVPELAVETALKSCVLTSASFYKRKKKL